jgi:hypothetical protein
MLACPPLHKASVQQTLLPPPPTNPIQLAGLGTCQCVPHVNGVPPCVLTMVCLMSMVCLPVCCCSCHFQCQLHVGLCPTGSRRHPKHPVCTNRNAAITGRHSLSYIRHAISISISISTVCTTTDTARPTPSIQFGRRYSRRRS